MTLHPRLGMERNFTDLLSPEDRAELHRRLRRIEGQVRGVEHMLDTQRSCEEIVQQLAAIKAAVHQAGLELLRRLLVSCTRGGRGSTEISHLLELFNRFA
ncbi:MAG: metal-sensitive transcriptional regulator [Armatimonadota bacterium]|nr:metal-sensitive transcriptional regulator [Armatimonadota bacterium]MDR5703756.1 metal-sensitive transcriptional regulator [Armatimonadota bacterium]MDR7433967.1 metal-sensitive transcriptional regulator [Armatimonadota bacterium]